MTEPASNPATGPGDDASIGVVLGRRTHPQPIGRLNFRERVATSLWFVPLVFVIGALVASKVIIQIDLARSLRGETDFLVSVDASAGAALTNTVATAMLTFIAVVFSTTLVAVQVAASQYSPRIVRLFVRSRVTHVTLGVFLATFVFSLDALMQIRSGDQDFVPALTIGVVYLLVLATIAMFITFVHGMVRLVRVQYLLKTITDQTRPVIRRDFPDSSRYVRAARPVEEPVRLVRNDGEAGVVQAMDLHATVGLAAQHGCWIELLVGVGDYLGTGTPVAQVHGPTEPPITADDITGHFLLGGERTLIQDPGFGLRQLVDTAIRALSPAVNDPTTAVQALNGIIDLLDDVADAPDPTGWYLDEQGVARVHRPEPTFEDLCRLGLTEIARYGADAPQVTRRLLAGYELLGDQVGEDRRHGLEALQQQLLAAMQASMPAAFLDVASQPDHAGLG